MMGKRLRDRIGKRQVLPVIVVTVLVAIVSIVYRPALENSFHLDDWPNIQTSAAVHMKVLDAQSIARAWTQGHIPRRPLANLSFALDWWRGAGEASAFQLTNVCIHVLASLAVLVLLTLVLGRRLGAGGPAVVIASALATAWWALHPIQTQAVTYIVQRMASMASLLILISVSTYLLGRASRRGRPWWFALSALSFLLGALTKENAWIVPGLILLAEFGVCRHGEKLVRNRIDLALLGLPLVAVLVVAVDVISGAGPISKSFLNGYDVRDFTLGERLLTQPRVLVFHVAQILWPLPARFSIEHDFALSTSLWSPGSTLPAIVCVLAWCAGGLWMLFARARRIVGFFMLWVPATLVIESSIIPLEMVFEHRMYLPTVGFAGLAGLGLQVFLSGHHGGVRIVTMFSSLVVVGLLSASTYARLPTWRTELTLYQQATRLAPNSARVWSNLGRHQLKAGAVGAAEASLGRALSLDGNDATALEDMGIILFDRRDYARAEALLERARAAMVPDASVLNHLGEVYLARGRVRRALDTFRNAISLAPRAPNLRWNLAVASEKAGDCQSGFREWRAYLALENNESERRTVEQHLEVTYHSEGGRCAGTSK